MLVLVGFMGAGKSTVGRLAAARLHLPFVDTDALVERRAGQTIRDIFATDGEPAFRDLEHEAVAEVVGGPDAVVALGGGAVQRADTRALLDGVPVVYLEVSLDEALRRTGPDSNRPVLAAGDVEELLRGRTRLYERVASFRVDTTGHAPEDVVERIVVWYVGDVSAG